MAALAALTAISSAALAQGNLGFLARSPVAYLDGEDLKLLREAAAEVLKTTERGVSRSWQNEASGNSGTIKQLSSFETEDQRECRRLRLESHTKKGGDGASTMTVCRTADGPWKVDSDAQPATSSAVPR